MNEFLTHILQEHGVVSTSSHPSLRGHVRGAVRRGELYPLLHGIYGVDHSVPSRIAAIVMKDPDCVIGADAAAQLSWWDELQVGTVQVNTRLQLPRRPGYEFCRREVPPEFVAERSGLRLSCPALSVIEMLAKRGPGVIDEALRRGVVTVDDLRTVLDAFANARGNRQARQWVEDSRDEPWSDLERRAHLGLREAGIDGWKANHRVELNGRWVYLDIALLRERIAVELDGWQYHRSFASFVRDRERDVQLTLRGWTVLRFTDSTIDALVPCVQQLLRQRK